MNIIRKRLTGHYKITDKLINSFKALKVGIKKYIFFSPIEFNKLNVDDQERIKDAFLDYSETEKILRTIQEESLLKFLAEIIFKMNFVSGFFDSPEWKYGWNSQTFERLDALSFRIYLHQTFSHNCLIIARAVFRYLKQINSSDQFLIELLGKILKEFDDLLKQFLKDYDFAVSGTPLLNPLLQVFYDLHLKIHPVCRNLKNSLWMIQNYFHLERKEISNGKEKENKTKCEAKNRSYLLCIE